MAQQKLYTEEQVREMLSMTDMIFENDLMPHVDIISCFKPIELPSDEEIEEEFDTHNEKYYIFSEGAKWMRDKILNK